MVITKTRPSVLFLTPLSRIYAGILFLCLDGLCESIGGFKFGDSFPIFPGHKYCHRIYKFFFSKELCVCCLDGVPDLGNFFLVFFIDTCVGKSITLVVVLPRSSLMVSSLIVTVRYIYLGLCSSYISTATPSIKN